MTAARSMNVQQYQQARDGCPEQLGIITTAGAAAKDNTSTAVAFTIDPGEMLLLQGDQDFYFLPVAAAGAVTGGATGTGVLITAGERVTLTMKADKPLLSVIRSSADVNVKVWRLR